jgi:ABC-type polysaccharide/polyol phosphate transport system ATPase subunit
MSSENTTPAVAGESPPVIEVETVEKTFRIPTHRVETLKERVVRPFSQGDFRELRALRDVSFDIRGGEFFGIVGRNGSGKSTLLKILAGIYAADQGEVRISGRIAPFIELGVGFNPDLTARENIILNGVMIGLPQREAERRLDSVVEFAELEDFVDLKLKNYSSGMLVRLGFSVMLESDAEILLIDEVLAVGDAAFQQKCIDVFYEMRKANRTIVLVTHDMSSVERFCDRALLLRGGKVDLLGAPEEVARHYLALNFEGRSSGELSTETADVHPASEIRIVDAWLESGGRRCDNIEHGDEVELHVLFEALDELPGAAFSLMVAAAAGVDVFGVGAGLEADDGDVLCPGERVHVQTRFANRLAPGRYVVKCWVTRNENEGDQVLHSPHVLDFVVFGTQHVSGLIALAEEPVARVVEAEAQTL